mgnify:CR=1 FL=1
MAEENKNSETGSTPPHKPLRLVPLHMIRSRENFWKLAVVVLLLVVSYFNYSYYQKTSEKAKIIVARGDSLQAMDSGDLELYDKTLMQAAELMRFFNANPVGAAPSIVDTPESCTFKFFIPNLNQYKTEILVKDGMMKLDGSAISEKDNKSKDGKSETMISHSFAYTLKLPDEALVDKIKLDKSANVMTVVIPKKGSETKVEPEPAKKTET